MPNSSCHFPNHKSVVLQVLHHSSVSWKITSLYFFRWNIQYFAQQEPIKVQIFQTFECSGQNSPNSFLKQQISFFQILHHFSGLWYITPLYFLYFQQKEPIKLQIWWNFTWAAKSLKFYTMMGSFCRNHVQFQVKKYRKNTSHGTEEWSKLWRKTHFLFKKLHEKFGEF